MGSGSPDYYTPDAQLADSLTQLEAAVTQLEAAVTLMTAVSTKTDTVITHLATQITKLIDIVTATQDSIYAGWSKCTTSNVKVIESNGVAHNFIVRAHKNNSSGVRLDPHNGAVTIAAGGSYSEVGTTTDLSIRAVSGTQYYQLEVS